MRLADRQDIGTGSHQCPGDGGRGEGRVGDGQDIGGLTILGPRADGGKSREDAARVGQRDDRPDRERPVEQLLAQVVGPADRAQGRVQDRDAVAEALRLFEAMRGEEDRDAALPEPEDQLVNLASGDRVEAHGWLVEEQDLRIAEQGAREGDPLAETLRQRSAGVPCSIGEVDRLQGAVDATARVRHLVQVGEALEVLEDAQAQVQAGRLGHDRDPAADLHAVLGRERESGDGGRPRGRGEERAERSNRGRLAGAIGAEEAEHLTASHLERDVGERAAVAELLREMLDRYRWRAALGGRRACGIPGAIGRSHLLVHLLIIPRTARTARTDPRTARAASRPPTVMR